MAPRLKGHRQPQEGPSRSSRAKRKKESPMKSLFALAEIFLGVLLASVSPAQAQSGFPPLPPVPQTPPLQNQPGATHFWFIAAGDNRPAQSGFAQPDSVTQIFNDAQQFNPAFFFWCGDIIYGHTDKREMLKAQYQDFFAVAQLAKVPVFNAPGNHEMDTLVFHGSVGTEKGDAQLQKYYLEFMNYPANAPPYGSFDYGNSHFIAVDTEEVPPANVRRSARTKVGKQGATTMLDPGFVSPLQLKLLAADLKANQAKAHIFVFMHHPIMPVRSGSALNKSNADALQALFKKYPNVSYVVAAHEHLYYNATGTTQAPADRQDPSAGGPSYLVSGGAGAPLDHCPGGIGPRCGAFNHYLVFEVDQNTVKVQVIPVASPTPQPK
jgi:Calcineurin-like phosphoesterase